MTEYHLLSAMRAEILEIQESFPVILRLRLQDGTIRDFDTTEDCVVRRWGRRVAMSELGASFVDMILKDGRICEITVVETP